MTAVTLSVPPASVQFLWWAPTCQWLETWMDSAPPKPCLPHSPCHPPPTAPPHLRTPQTAALSGESTACAPAGLPEASLGGGGWTLSKSKAQLERKKAALWLKFHHCSLWSVEWSPVFNQGKTTIIACRKVKMQVYRHNFSCLFSPSSVTPSCLPQSFTLSIVAFKLVLRAGVPTEGHELAILLPFLLSRPHSSQPPWDHHFAVVHKKVLTLAKMAGIFKNLTVSIAFPYGNGYFLGREV